MDYKHIFINGLIAEYHNISNYWYRNISVFNGLDVICAGGIARQALLNVLFSFS